MMAYFLSVRSLLNFSPLAFAKASFREPNRFDREQSEEKSSLGRITNKQIDCGMVLKIFAIQILIRNSQY